MINKRIAGSKLVLEPIGDVSADLKKALENLKQVQAGNPVDSSAPLVKDYPRIDESFEVDGHRVALHANPMAIQWNSETPIDGKVIGNQQEMRELMSNPPEVEYGMTWSVDGNYNDHGSNLSRGTRLKIAREAQRRWGQAFKQLPENAIVTNSPVGGSSGDYGRADLYMAAGFGPIQHNGNQFGIVRNGEIQPLSPFVADQRHVSHLAKRARMAGDVDLSEAMLQANKANADINPYEGNVSYAKGGGYDDYDDYDDDYTPPVVRGEAESIIRNEKERRDGVPEIAMRQAFDDERAQRGLDFEVGADDVQAMRDAQLAALQRDAPYRGVADALQEVSPRALPQRITANDLGRRRSYRNEAIPSGVYSLRDLNQVPPNERRDVAIAMVRDEVDRRVQGRGGYAPQYLGGRNDVKGMMVEPIEYGPGYLMQELYSTQDVADARRIQEALAIAGEMAGPEGGNRRRASRRGGYQGQPVVDGAGKAGQEYGPTYSETRVQNMPQLTTSQQATRDGIVDYFERRNNAPATQNELLGMLDDRFDATGTAGLSEAVFQNMYGATSRADLTRGVAVDPNMSREQAENLLRMSVEQPGRTSREELAQAVVNLEDSDYSPISDDIIRQMLELEDVGIAAGRGEGGNMTGTMLADSPLTRLEDPRLRRPNIPVREMQLRAEDQRRAANTQRANETNPAYYDEAPEGMSFDEFQQWEQNRNRQAPEQRVLVADEAVADAVGEGVFSRSLAQPANYALATERGQRQGPPRRPRARRPQATSVEGLVNDAVETARANGTYPPLLNLDDLAAVRQSPLEELMRNAEEARNAPPLF